MLRLRKKRKLHLPFRLTASFIIVAFSSSLMILPPKAHAQSQSVLNLPAPGVMVTPTPGFMPAVMKGIKIFPQNPLRFDFIIDTGNARLGDEALETESTKLIKYFLASLTVPDDELWVNLSPYEQDRIIPDQFGVTEMGRDLLAQDYVLKQFTASLIYPEEKLGREFWERVYAKARELYGASEISVNTFNKVWVVPESATVYESGDMALIVESRLKVMLEGDYLALKDNMNHEEGSTPHFDEGQTKKLNDVSSQIIRDIILPEIEKEVNSGQNFVPLRQIYHSMILAAWFKRNLRESLLGKIYVEQNKVGGVDIEDKQVREKIYQQYLKAYRSGVYNYIKNDYDPLTREVLPRKYFSGGIEMEFRGAMINNALQIEQRSPAEILVKAESTTHGPLNAVSTELNIIRSSDEDLRPQETANSDRTLLTDVKRGVFIGFLSLLLSSLPVESSTAGQFGSVVYDTGKQTWQVRTEKGDTLESIARQAVGIYHSLTPSQIPGGSLYWKNLIKEKYIDSYGVIQPKLRALSSPDDLADAVVNEDVRKEMFEFFRKKLEKVPDWESMDVEGLIEVLKDGNYIHVDMNGQLSVNQVLDLAGANDYLRQLQLIQTSRIVHRQDVDLNGRNMEVVFIDEEESPFWRDSIMAITLNDKIFMNLNSFAKAGEKLFKESEGQEPEYANPKGHVHFGDDRLLIDLYKGKKPLELALGRLQSLWFHEVAGHGLTLSLIDGGKNSLFERPITSEQFATTGEVSGLLAEIAGAASPRLSFAQWSHISYAQIFSAGKQYVRAAEIIQKKMWNKLGFSDFAKRQLYEEIRREGVKGELHLSGVRALASVKGEGGERKVVEDLMTAGYLDANNNNITDKYNPLDPGGFKIKGYSAEDNRHIFDMLLLDFYPRISLLTVHIETGGRLEDIDRYDWYKTLTDEQVAQAAREVYKEIFGVELPGKDFIHIPEAVKDYMKEKYFPDDPINERESDIREGGQLQSEEPVGGIDLDPDMLDLQTRGAGRDFDGPVDPQAIEALQIEGVSPVIIQIVPTNLPMFIGGNDL